MDLVANKLLFDLFSSGAYLSNLRIIGYVIPTSLVIMCKIDWIFNLK